MKTVKYRNSRPYGTDLTVDCQIDFISLIRYYKAIDSSTGARPVLLVQGSVNLRQSSVILSQNSCEASRNS